MTMVDLTVANFDEEVTNQDKPVLVDWWGESCEDCKALMPSVEALSDQYGDQVHFTRFNTSQKKVRRFCIKYKIFGLPVISIFKNGEKAEELTKDDCTKENVENMIKKYL